jgi:hypothetical protein
MIVSAMRMAASATRSESGINQAGKTTEIMAESFAV